MPNLVVYIRMDTWRQLALEDEGRRDELRKALGRSIEQTLVATEAASSKNSSPAQSAATREPAQVIEEPRMDFAGCANAGVHGLRFSRSKPCPRCGYPG